MNQRTPKLPSYGYDAAGLTVLTAEHVKANLSHATSAMQTRFSCMFRIQQGKMCTGQLNLPFIRHFCSVDVHATTPTFLSCPFLFLFPSLRLVRWPFRFLTPQIAVHSALLLDRCARHYAYLSLLPSCFCSFCLSFLVSKAC